MMKTLKNWIVAYRDDQSVMDEFVVYETVHEQNRKGQYDEVRYIRTKDKKLNQIMKQIEAKYSGRVDRKDVNEYLLHAIVEIFETADIERSPAEIIRWAESRIEYIVIDELKRNHSLELDIVSENEVVSHDDKDDEINISDFQMYQNWLKGEEANTYEKFLEFYGGLENILSDKQYEIYTYMKSGLTQQEIAEKMGVSQQYISKTFQSALKRIRAEYLNFRTYRIMMKSNTYQKVKTFVKYTENILEYVIDDEAMLFQYTMNFLRENEEDDISFELAHENKKDLSTGVLDALFDYMSVGDLKWFMPYWRGEKEVTMKKEKEKFVRIVNKSLVQYLIGAEKVLKRASETIVEREIHEKVIDLIS
jgi:RNA polymerase sigma factor (sigma-70 family)